MVRAILDGRKTQTRRVIKPQPSGHYWETRDKYKLKKEVGYIYNENMCWLKYQHLIPQNQEHPEYINCPYGCGELWVRETFAIESNLGIEGSNIYKSPFSDGRPTNWCLLNNIILKGSMKCFLLKKQMSRFGGSILQIVCVLPDITTQISMFV